MTTLKGVFPNTRVMKQKNFILANVKNLHRMGHCIYSHEEIEKTKKLHMHLPKNTETKNCNILSKTDLNVRTNKYERKEENSSVINKIIRQQKLSKNCSTSMLNTNNSHKKKVLCSRNDDSPIKQKEKKNKVLYKTAKKFHRKVVSDPSFTCIPQENDNDTEIQIIVKNQSTQTLDIDQMEDLYSEGSIRYPSNHSEVINRNVTNHNINEQSGNRRTISSDQENIKTIEKNTLNKSDFKCSLSESLSSKIDFIKLNKERISMANKTTQNKKNTNNQSSTNYRKGVVPKYIKNKKVSNEKEQKSNTELLDPDCPNGHVSLPDDERKETLRMLKKNYQDYVNELNMLPIKTDTLRAQRRKMEIEKQLNKLEEGIKVFSRSKVYVKVNL